MGLSTLIRNDDTVYCIGGRTGLLARLAPEDKRGRAFDQWTVGLHHFCVRARSREDVDAIAEHAASLGARMIHAPEDGDQFAPGYYSVLFEDPDGIRVEVNYVPGKGHLGEGGRLGPGGDGPRNSFP
jgi:catechol 2,3-dioxygenase-like lactoylglutathione lyase family enzyme